MDYAQKALELHEKYRGKIGTEILVPLNDREDLSAAYTPGVAEPCCVIAKEPEKVYDYTLKSRTVAIVTDGSAVLGLGNIGALAGLPVMEGKAALFKKFGGVDAFPICLSTQESEEIIAAVKAIAPSFGAINLEDIASPKCFEIEERLKAELDIPVFHDDQHGTAIVVLAAVLNALKVVGKSLENVKIVVNGPDAAGTAIIRILLSCGAKNVIACDENGALYAGKAGLSGHKTLLSEETNPGKEKGNLADVLRGADVFIGVSVPGILTPEMIQTMAKSPIVFAMANPTPEIGFEEAKKAGAAVVGTGRSDFPNQVNNVLAFPGVFRGALESRAKKINEEMKLAAAKAITGLVPKEKLSPDFIIPDAFDPRVAETVAKAVAEAAKRTGVCRK